jgi:hypothetical protein
VAVEPVDAVEAVGVSDVVQSCIAAIMVEGRSVIVPGKPR